MDPIEKAIRNAFEKGNAEDRAFREKVYRSAFAALDRAIQANSNLTVEAAIARRRNLQEKIASIESEFLTAVRAAPEAPRPVQPQPDPPPPPRNGGPAPAPFVAPPVAPPRKPAALVPEQERTVVPDVAPVAPAVPAAAAPPVEVEPSRSGPVQAEPVVPPIVPDPPVAATAAIDEVAPDRNDLRAQERRRPFAAIFLAVTLISAAAIGGWWAYRTGLIKLPGEYGAVPNPPQIVEDEDFVPEDEEGGGPLGPGSTEPPRDWVTVFTPDDPSLVNAPAGASAEVSEDESGTFIRIRSGSSGAAVIFDVGQGVLEAIAGKKAVFDIIARAEEGKETQISVNCDFGELGDCGRKRYAVGYERGEYLFDVELPAKSPGAAGSIAINSDFANEGKAVDIYEIRVSAE